MATNGVVASISVVNASLLDDSGFILSNTRTPVAIGPDNFLTPPYQLDHFLSQDIDFDFDSMDPDFFSILDPPDQHEISATVKPKATTISAATEAFQRSPWIWNPVEKDSALAAQGALTSSKSSLPDLASVRKSALAQNIISDHRDQLLGMVLETSRLNPQKITSFPSFPVQLIGALIAAGSQQEGETAIWEFGLALHESVRLSLAALLETDNTWGRDLNYIRAYQISIGLGLWSGFKRKMEIAEGFRQIPTTMLRRTGAFSWSHYYATSCQMIDTSESLEQKWKSWVRKESTKRLAIHTFISDVQTSIAFCKAPTMTTLDHSLPIPASEALWLATTSEMWKECFEDDNTLPRALDVSQDLTLLDGLGGQADIRLTYSLVLYGVWSQIWSYQDVCTRRLSRSMSANHTPDSASMWHMHQYSELYPILVTLRDRLTALDRATNRECLVAKLFMMLLHVSVLDLQQACGVSGGDEAESVLEALQERWFPMREARCAVWHAGQVLRAARAVPPTSLRDFYAVAVYQASLCLRVYGLLCERDDHRQGPHQVRPSSSDSYMNVRIPLDGEDLPERNAFVELNRGIPCVTSTDQSEHQLIPLTSHAAAMTTSLTILRNNFSAVGTLHPLVANLVELMQSLGEAKNDLL
ncbi:hypothetical protein K491DRAFT_779723 [Lophiostoma macrostomum CBS 122681]|uniref:Xylanolytic transcriptional activator regulatory domain-containing protein n=1 Tax=Lophiostoma macrostomum CBS 122681 TaxID=1314788 RepID=A0A6A6T2E0_9PLEO|nr:hypothetical protein K491DRAFT_779723 [Lophiostoma macrostomum CBS 122681]